MFAVIALMMGSVEQSHLSKNALNSTVTGELDLDHVLSVEIATATTFCVGIVLAAMALLQVQFITAYLSDQLVGGFTTGAACHVFASQLPKLFAVKIPNHSGLFKLIYILRDFFSKIGTTNIPDLVTSMICIIFLFVGKLWINPIITKRIPVPVPFELIAVVTATLLSYFLNFHKDMHMKVVSNIPTGFPAPRPPRFDLMGEVFLEALVIAIVIYVVTFSVGKLFAKKHGYRVSGSQELRALSIVQIICCFLHCHPASGSLTRSTINSQIGTKSQVTSFVSAALMLLVILWLGPLLEALPMCILSSIIVVALQGMFMQFKDVGLLWKTSKIDLAIWLVGFGATVIWDVSQGLAVAIGFALVTVIFRSQWPKTVKLAQVGDTNLYRDLERYDVREAHPHIVVFRFDAPLLFLNVEHFKESGVKMVDDANSHLKEIDSEFSVKYLIVDGSGFTHIDQMGVNGIKELTEDLKRGGVDVYLASCKAQVRELCQTCGLYANIPKSHFFPDIHDAVLFALEQDEMQCQLEKEEEQNGRF
ncbi:hypothetical protein L596_020058 [Steinernema carpocapsae]|uniref:STAS domain-containing protein n=1 Tax=Steinernema carpocapsae TaxID=34508 RepID=A0A4U5MSF7_STECR|nr:hypothetical protein L596_020058 [Steinernema carpocapsae]